MAALLERIDHLVYTTGDLESSVRELELRLGVRASPGGSHPGRATRNALLALGPRCYLEILGPDPAQAPPPHSRWFQVERLPSPRLLTWAANCENLAQFVDKAAERRVALGTIAYGSRTREDGVTLHWRYSEPTTMLDDGIVPFFIDWGSSMHPAESAATGVTLIGLRAEHPRAQQVRERLQLLGITLDVTKGEQPALFAELQTPRGVVTLT